MPEHIASPQGYYATTKEYVQDALKMGDSSLEYWEFPLDKNRVPFVAAIPHGRVWGRSGCVVTPNNRVLWDVSKEWDDTPLHLPIFHQHSLPKPTFVDGIVAVLNKVGSDNYFHWMFDVVPRVHLIRSAGIPVDKYVVGEDPKPFQLETLRALGIHEHQLIPSSESVHMECRQLVVPSLPHEAHWVHDFLRQTFLDNPAQKAGQNRIYVSRNGCVGRRVLNEDDVMSVLSGYGFQRVCPESMSVSEQAQMFSSASVVLGPQGAAFANVVFCRPHTKLIELMAPTFFIGTTELICRVEDVDYFRMMATSVRNPSFAQPYWSGWDNVLINTNVLVKILHRAGLSV